LINFRIRMSIPLHLINGFLGSGKTTFLLHYLDTFASARKIGVIQNEFSSAGIDGELITRQGKAYSLLEVNNGSVFCVCLLGGFIDSLSSFIDDWAPDEIIMEASGMSDPVSIGQIFQSPKLKNKVFLGYSWTIVDARNFHKLTAIRSRLEHQIRIADTVVVNKSDLVEEDIELVINDVKKINPFALVQRSSHANINFVEQKNGFKFFPAEESTESCRPDLQSVVIKTNSIITLVKLKQFIESVKTDFVRCKGFVNTDKDKKIVIQGIFDDYSFKEVEWFAGSTELIGIGKFSDNQNFTETFEKYCR
jgi:G3E family GTPase